MDKKIYLPIAIAVIVAFIIFSPHYNYPFPLHIDEWHHITETYKLQNGEYSWSVIGYRLGFHIFLLPISKIFSLVEIYQYLPAIWMALTSLVLFYVVSKKTNYKIGIFSMLFFASLKSNVNLLGPWFFVPLTFSFPFILLYMYLFDSAFQNGNKKHLIYSLIIMAFLIPVHSVSVLFSVPLLIAYSLYNKEFLIKERKTFLLFLIIPLLGIIFFSYVNKISLISSISEIFNQLQFHKGWGVLELKNSPLETYSFVGYLLALIGFTSLYKKNKQKYSLYLLWPIILILSIMIFRIFDVSFLSPYQRNFYYLSICLPFLSAAGLNSFINFGKSFFSNEKNKKIAEIVIILVTTFLIFQNYNSLPEQTDIYHVIEKEDYKTLLLLKDLEPSKVMAFPTTSVALYSLTGHTPVATLSFYGIREDVHKFYLAESCEEKNSILRKHNVRYLISKIPKLCNYEEFRKSGEDYIYKIN